MNAGSDKYGIAIVANDKVLPWLLPFLESYSATNAGIPLHLIPFDDNVASTRRAAELYGAIWVNDDMAELDALARRLYPFFPQHRRRLRKLQALALPLDQVIYLDVDTILFRDFRTVFGRLRPRETDFIIASASENYVYNRKRAEHAFLDGVTLFNDGFFLTSRHILSLADFERIAAADGALFHSVRKRGMLFAQPLVNFVVHRLGLKVRALADCVPNASNESFYKAEGVRMAGNGPLDWQGGEIYFAHWAGAVGLPKRRIFDSLWQDYARRARMRMAA
ncbi:MAG: hypothetical protein ACREHV_16050 [Rhizomicrobium sp.]